MDRNNGAKSNGKLLPFRPKKRRGYKWLKALFAIGIIGALLAGLAYISPARVIDKVELNPGFMRVIDADTIAIGKTVIRLKGIAAPEKGHPTFDDGRKFLGRLLRRAIKVNCNLTSERTYGRRVGRCFFKMPNDEIVDIQKAVVAAGYARGCVRYGGWRYLLDETAISRSLPFPDYCWGFSPF